MVAIDVRDGLRVLEFATAVAVTALVALAFLDGPWRWAAIAVGTMASVVRALWFVGPHYLWLEGDTVVEQDNRRLRRLPLEELQRVEVVSVPRAGKELVLHGPSGTSVSVRNLNGDTEAFCRELGRRLRQGRPGLLARVGPSTSSALGNP